MRGSNSITQQLNNPTAQQPNNQTFVSGLPRANFAERSSQAFTIGEDRAALACPSLLLPLPLLLLLLLLMTHTLLW
jgi:hypothetical protein